MNYIELYLSKIKLLQHSLDSPMPNLNEQNKLLEQINKLTQMINNDRTISIDIKSKLLSLIK